MKFQMAATLGPSGGVAGLMVSEGFGLALLALLPNVLASFLIFVFDDCSLVGRILSPLDGQP